MKINIKRIVSICTFIVLFLGIYLADRQTIYADTPADWIEEYTITVDVNQDATLNIKYHIKWKVLESDENGPLSWVKIGIPNSHVKSYKELSDNILSVKIDTKGGSYADVRFLRKYYAGDEVEFDFEICQDYMYQAVPDDGRTTYYFTPGWFDEIDVSKLKIRWNCDKAVSWTPNCLVEDGYLTWEDELPKGEKYSISVDYDIDAFDFDLDKEYIQSKNKGLKIFFWDWYDPEGRVDILFMFGFILYAIFNVITVIRGYFGGTGFGEENRIERTKITYYTSCPNCGGVRAPGKDVCSYCGTNMIKSEEKIKEKKADKEDKQALKFKKSGMYQYGADPNVFVRVKVTRIVRPYSSSGGHSSCAHSSCACACACACAGGGRAGCTSKDFMVIDPKIIKSGKHYCIGKLKRKKEQETLADNK